MIIITGMSIGTVGKGDASVKTIDIVVRWIALQFEAALFGFENVEKTRWNTFLLQIRLSIDGSRVQVARTFTGGGREKENICRNGLISANSNDVADDQVLPLASNERLSFSIRSECEKF